jgi:glycosyltransferase involved in cell wall biosynthesis
VRVLGFGTYDVTTHPRSGIVLDGLRAQGHDVAEANEPLGFSTAERVAMLGRPWLAYRLLLRMLRCWLRLVCTARSQGRPDVVLVGYLGHFDVVLARLLFRRSRIVLDLLIFAADTARDRGVTGRARLWLLDRLDRIAVRCADLVVVDTDEHLALLPAKARAKGVVVAVGAPAEWFAAATPMVPGVPLRVVFFGLYTPLQGAPVIGAAIGQLSDEPGIEFTMIGSGQDLDATRRAAGAGTRTTWREWVEPADLPGLVAAHDVCLGIFGTTPKAMRVVPNKIFQGAAVGCALVTSDTPPQRRALGDDAVLVPPGDPTALAETLRALAADRARLTTLRSGIHERAVREFTAAAVVAPLGARLAIADRAVP